MNREPTKPGFYWAKWMITGDHVPEEYTPFKTWEPVEVYENDAGELFVWILGHSFVQPVDCFHWGEELKPPEDKADAIMLTSRRQREEDAFKRYRKMTPEERMDFSSKRRTR